VFEASNGDLYVVSGTRNLVVFSGEKAVATNAAPDLVVGMAEDEHGVVVSVGGELYRAGTNYFRPYAFTNAEQPPFYWINNLASGRDGGHLGRLRQRNFPRQRRGLPALVGGGRSFRPKRGVGM
jgi:hypothetical protein